MCVCRDKSKQVIHTLIIMIIYWTCLPVNYRSAYGVHRARTGQSIEFRIPVQLTAYAFVCTQYNSSTRLSLLCFVFFVFDAAASSPTFKEAFFVLCEIRVPMWWITNESDSARASIRWNRHTNSNTRNELQSTPRRILISVSCERYNYGFIFANKLNDFDGCECVLCVCNCD